MLTFFIAQILILEHVVESIFDLPALYKCIYSINKIHFTSP